MTAAMQLRRAGCLALLLGCAIALAGPQEAAEKPSGSVSILVVDEDGRTLPFGITRFTGLQREGEMSGHFSGLFGSRIPYGMYEYSVTGLGPGVLGEEIPGRVRVQWPEQLIVLEAARLYAPGFAFDFSTPRDFVLQGRLDPMPGVTAVHGPGPDSSQFYHHEPTPGHCC
jgi:hypothetical protein